MSVEQFDCYCFLIRHGATASNLANPPILQGRSINGPLSETGQQQAAEAANCLETEPITAVYCSPLVRALETANAIAAPHGLTPIVVEPLTEVDVGAWESRSWVEIQETEPEAYEQFQSDPAAHHLCVAGVAASFPGTFPGKDPWWQARP